MNTHIWLLVGALSILGISPASLLAQDDIHVLFQDGRAAYNAGQYEIAREKLALVLLKNPEHPQTRAMMAQIELKVGTDNALLRKSYDKVILDKFEVVDVELAESIQALKILSKNASDGKITPNVIVSDPDLAKKRVSLSLEKIPLSEALRYLAKLTGAQLSYDKNAVIYSKPGS